MEIPTFIKAKIADNEIYKIPKIIMQTYKTNKIHNKIYNNIKNFLDINPTYDYYLITDDMGRSLIKKNFNQYILNAFDKLNLGAAKGDFLRYVALYEYGGIYIDLDSSITADLNKCIDHNIDHYIVWDGQCNIMNTPIISKPKNPIILMILNEIVRRINNYEPNIFNATGPTVITDVIYKDITNKSVYNTKKNIPLIERRKLWQESMYYKNGKIVYFSCESEVSGIQFRMKDYNNDLLYPNNDKYTVSDFPTPYLYKYIHIGISEANNKKIKLNKIYHPDTKLVFLHIYCDKFSYVFNDNELTITRTDTDRGWGQDLIAYL